VRTFRTAAHAGLTLHYPSELDGKLDLPALLEQSRADLDGLAQRFGRPIRGRVVIFLFATHRSVGAVFGPHYAGTALALANAIVVASDCNLAESIRHEFAHLFSLRWNQSAPALLSEGLSVWLQVTEGGRSIDSAARSLMGNRALRLHFLLKPAFFFSEPHRYACYLLAGSFTGFLIRRYGWQPYRRLFRLCNGRRFRAKFRKCLGVSLEKAEWQWRNEVMVMDILKRRLRRPCH
jgi:hypothetical protein